MLRPYAQLPPFVRGQQVHGGRANKARYKRIGRRLIQLGRRAHLLDIAAAHQHHLVSHSHGLGLVVRDINHRHAKALLQGADIGTHLLAQLGIQIGKRLIHKANRSLRHNGTPQRHALALPARHLRGAAIEIRAKPEQLCRISQAARALGRWHITHLQAKFNVFSHRQMRKQGVRLKHHRHPALRWRLVGNVALANVDGARVRHLKPCNQAQRG